jgi:hypothetical protein
VEQSIAWVKDKRRHVARQAILIALILAGVLFRVELLIHLPREVSVCTADFLAFYAGGKLAGSPAMYSPEAVFHAEKQAAGCYLENLIFVKPPFYALIMWPFAQLPFMTAFALWRVLGLAAVGVFIWKWPDDKLAATAACAWFLPLAGNFTVGQDVAFVLLIVVGAYRLLKTGHDFWAGVVLGICAIKFHLFPLLPLLLIHRRLWRTIAGGACTGIALIGASFLACGPHWLEAYLTALRDSRLNPSPWNMANLNGLFSYNFALVLPTAILLTLLCWHLIRKSSLEMAFAVVLAGGVLITPHNTVVDALLFLPLLLMARKSSLPVTRAMAVFLLTPIYRFLPAGTLQVMIIGILSLSAFGVRGARAEP